MNERRTELIYGQVLQRMDMTRETGDEELQELIRMTLEEASEKEYLPLNEKIELSRELFHAFRKLDILQELLEDPKITEIMVNERWIPCQCSHETGGGKRTNPYDTNIPGRTIDDEEADRLWKYDRRSGTVHQKIGYCKI